MGNSLCFKDESRILKIPLNKPQPNNKTANTRFCVTSCHFNLPAAALQQSVTRQHARFRNSLARQPETNLGEGSSGWEFSPSPPAELGAAPEVKCLPKKTLCAHRKATPAALPSGQLPRARRATGRIRGGSTSCLSRRSPQLLATTAGGGSSAVGCAGSIPGRGHARCPASGLQRAGGRPRALPEAEISNFAALGTLSGNRRESASHSVGHVRGGHPHARPLPLLLPPPRTSPGRGTPCAAHRESSPPTCLPLTTAPERAGRVALSRRRTCRTRRAPPWWPGCWS